MTRPNTPPTPTGLRAGPPPALPQPPPRDEGPPGPHDRPGTRRRRLSRGAITAFVAAGTVALAVVLVTWGPLPRGGGAPGAAGALSDAAAEVTAGARALHGDGRVPRGGVSPFDGSSAAVAGLNAPLRAALQAAARDADDDGVEVVVASGWRSADAQRALFEEAVAEHGSVEEARKFVLPPELSSHVRGDAVDVGPTKAAYWFADHGSDFGLCQTYANEVWHYELATSPGGRCPAQLPDAASVVP